MTERGRRPTPHLPLSGAIAPALPSRKRGGEPSNTVFKAIPGGLEINRLYAAIPKTRREPKPIPRLYYKEDKNLKKNNRGFTLAELLIVVAIIAVLVAIAIPVFTNQLEKAREATDMANIRNAYATAMAHYLDGTKTDGAFKAESEKMTQTTAGWATIEWPAYLGTKLDTVEKDKVVVVTITEGTDGTATATCSLKG